MPKELDTDEVKAVNEFIAKAPEYFRKTDQMYQFLITGDPLNNKPSVAALMQDTQDKVEALYRLGNIITGAVVAVIVGAVFTGITLLIRLAPILAELEALARQKP